jgi:hypothetical protein
VDHGLLVRTAEPEGIALARAPDDVPVAEVLALIRDPAGRDAAGELQVPAVLAELLAVRDRAVDEALAGITLRTLAGEAPREAAVTRLASYRRG